MKNKTLREEFEKKFVEDNGVEWKGYDPEESPDIEDIWNWFESKLNQKEAEAREELLNGLSVKEALRWSDKHRKLGDSEGVRAVHIKQLLQSLSQNTNEK